MLIRDAEPADALAVAEVHVRSWQVGYRGLIADAALDRLDPHERARRYTFGGSAQRRPVTFVAVEADRIRGFATVTAADPAASCGELGALYVDPAAWGHGIGGRLLEDAHERLTTAGFPRAVLWLLAGNARAERLYRAHGWTPDDLTRTRTVWDIPIEEARFSRAFPTPRAARRRIPSAG
ncbi:MAG TPA: GNAT family N-acetyltransferase [Frankiaceae bacterium]|jgi:GNAT superfamily N-acetyltransferase|nr:GNAT family N-acetyltransferase [Frankiaceae bacterium]